MIITNDESLLRVKCEEVALNEVDELIQKLETELDNSNKSGKFGVGLAAPQIGIAKNISIVRFNNDVKINLINCNIEKYYDPALFKQEGCLSFPNKVNDTIRYQEIYVTNNLIYPHSFIATGIVAVVCQHEIDHLNSTLFFDRANNVKTKVGPNDICPCGSKIKYKKCCGK